MKEEKNQTQTLIIGLILCILGLVLQSWYSTKTATIDYVDKKCLEVKKEMEDRQTQTNVRLTNIENTTQNIYNYLLNQKK